MSRTKRYPNWVFYKRFEECIFKSGMTQKKIAELVGVDRKVITSYKNGVSTPDIVIAMKFAKLFNVSIDWLVGVKDE